MYSLTSLTSPATGVFFCVRASSRVSAPVSNVASDTGRRVTPVFDGVDEMIAAVAVDHGASRSAVLRFAV